MTNPARTLLVVTPCFPPEGGGLEAYVDNLTRELRLDHGWRVVVATSGTRFGRTRREVRDGVVVYRLPFHARVSNTRFGFGWRWQLRRIVESERPALINAHLPVPGLADLVPGVAGDIPIVVTYHAGSMRKGRLATDIPIALYEKVLGRHLLSKASWIIASSDFVRDSHLASFRAKTTTVEPAADPGRFRPAPARAADRLLFVAGLRPSDVHKGLDDLLRAMPGLRASHPKLELDVIGAGEALPVHEARCRELGIDSAVRFRGRLGGEDLAAAYRDASILVLPSHNDSFPMVLLEAMASGLPVVSTTVGGIPSLVADGENGLLVPPGDVEALANRIGGLLDDPSLGDRMGSAGRRKVTERYTWGRQAEVTNGLFESILAGGPADGRPRVAVVAPYFAPKIGGLEQYAAQVAAGVQRRGDHEVIVLTSKHRDGQRSAGVFDGVTVLRFRSWVRASNTPVSPTWWWQLRRAMRDNRVDVVHVHTPVPFMGESATVAAGRRPIVVTYHAGSMRKGRQPVDLVVASYERWVLPRLLGRAATIVAVSPSVEAHLATVGASPVRIVPPGVDLAVFTPAPDVSGVDQPSVVLFVGRLERTSAWKGVDHLLRAFALVVRDVPCARLVLVGDGDARDDHRRLALKLGIADAVELTGALRGDALVAAYRSAAVVVLPSTAAAESFGMSLIEAMACGKPVIGSDIGGIPFVIDDGVDGFLVPPGDVEALAARCRQLLADPGLGERLGTTGRRKVEDRFGWDDRVATYCEVYDDVAMAALSAS